MTDRLFLASFMLTAVGFVLLLGYADPELSAPLSLVVSTFAIGCIGFWFHSTLPIPSSASRWHRGFAWVAMKLHLLRRMDCGCYYGSTGPSGTKPNHRPVDDPVDGHPHEREYWRRSVDGAEVTYTRMIETLERCTECGGHFYHSEIVYDGRRPSDQHICWVDEPAPDAVTETDLDVVEE